jgi:hypothetical protein
MTQTQEHDDKGNFLGYEPRECGEHRTVGAHRAWCFDCSEWCSPLVPCARCGTTAWGEAVAYAIERLKIILGSTSVDQIHHDAAMVLAVLEHQEETQT